MKSYIENELKQKKIPKKYNKTKESNRSLNNYDDDDDGPIYWQPTALPIIGQLGIQQQRCKTLR